jgi:uncharacterized membrane protein YfcA
VGDFVLFVAVGFLAQAVDGALGLAYGAVSSTVLLAFGVSPAHASAAVHAAEVFTTAASGSSHLYHRNVDWPLFWHLVPFGVLGGCAGAYLLTSFPGELIRPFVTAYLATIGVWLLVRSFRKIPSNPVPARIVAPLGAAGGFLDAAGGGGWGPIVSTGLLGAGAPPRYVIGTVNAAEFIVTTSITLGFIVALLTGHWEKAGGVDRYAAAAAGLVVGGLGAAPLAGWFVSRLPERLLLRVVGMLIVLLAGWQTAQQFGIA